MSKYRRKSNKKENRIWGRYAPIPKTALSIFLISLALLRAGDIKSSVLYIRDYGAKLGRACDAFQAVMAEEAPKKADKPAVCPVYESPRPPFYEPAEPPLSNTKTVTIDGKSGGCKGSGSVYIKNQTDYDIDIQKLLSSPHKVKLSGDKVQGLIIHTHGTEAYTPTAANPYKPSDTDRTTDKDHSVIRIGREICAILNKRGIKTLHSETLNDSPVYSGCYSRALDDISLYMKENPSIKFILDVHRDAMVTPSGTKYKTVADIGGQQAAQMMLVCGTDAGGLVHGGWRDNLSFQLKLHDRINTQTPGIMRPLNIRAARFNQHVTPGSMLLEVGTSGNTLEEALISSRIFAEALADMLLS